MIKLMKVDELVEIAAGAGIVLKRPEDQGYTSENLYVYATNDAHKHNVYVGKSVDRSRAVAEKNVEGQGYKERIGVGFSALIAENNATRHSFHYDNASFNPNPLAEHIETYNWTGDPIDELKKKLVPGATLTVEEVEQILIRIHVCTGRLIGNSQFASQWAGGGVYKTPNLVALLAADIARESGKAYLLSEGRLTAELADEGVQKSTTAVAE